MPVLFRSGGGAGSRPPPRTGSGKTDFLNVQAGTQPGRRVSTSSGLSNTPDHVTAGTPASGVTRRRTLSLPKPPPDWKKRLKIGYKKYHLKYLNTLVFIMIYMFLGAIVFLWLEGSADARRKEEEFYLYRKEKELLLRRMDEIIGDRAARRRPVRRKFISEAVSNFQEKIGFSISNETKWDFSTAMYFAGTLFTTIGYGDVACITVAGRIATVIYSCIGIPLMLITLNDLGKFLYESINRTVKWIEDVIRMCRICSLSRVKKNTIDIKIEDIDAMEKGDTQTIDSCHSELGSDRSSRADDLEEEDLDELPPPRMSVQVALGITVGWIFFCSWLFRFWENWTYGESLYFMFISCSTIGLGDISVEHREMMVICFVFVIIGLSLVSMTINVIQVAIEDFYISFLMKLIMEYQEKMAAGGDQMGASVGMMRMWGNNKTAKFLLRGIGKEKRRMAMEKVEIEAKAKGIDIPPILTDLDDKTGMPKILQIQESKERDGDVNNALEMIVEKHAAIERERKESEIRVLESNALEEESLIPIHFAHDADTQTETTILTDESEQTEKTSIDELGVQTDREEVIPHSDAQCQTILIPGLDGETQTLQLVMVEQETCTPTVSNTETESQTNILQTKEQELQTYVVELADAETSTAVETKNIRIQTPQPQIEERTIQTEDLASSSPSKMAAARKRIRRALHIASRPRHNSLGGGPTMQDWVEEPDGEDQSSEVEGEDQQGEEEEVEILQWDPVDGLHAEKQLPVNKLKQMFDRKRSE